MKLISKKILLVLLSASFGLGASGAYAQDAFSIKEVLRGKYVSIVAKNASGWTLVDDSTLSNFETLELRRIGNKLFSPDGLVADVADIVLTNEERLIGIGNQGEIFLYSRTDSASQSNFVISKVMLEDRSRTVLYQFSTRKRKYLDPIISNGVGQFAMLLREHDGKVDGSVDLLMMDQGAIAVVPVLAASKKFEYNNITGVTNDDGRIVVQASMESRKKNQNKSRQPVTLIFSGSFSEKTVAAVESRTVKALSRSRNSIQQMVGDTLWIGGFSEFLVDARSFRAIPSARFNILSEEAFKDSSFGYVTFTGSMGADGVAPIIIDQPTPFNLVVISLQGGKKKYRCPLFNSSDGRVGQIYAINSGKIFATLDSAKQQKLIELSPIENSQTKPADEIGRCLQVK